MFQILSDVITTSLKYQDLKIAAQELITTISQFNFHDPFIDRQIQSINEAISALNTIELPVDESFYDPQILLIDKIRGRIFNGLREFLSNNKNDPDNEKSVQNAAERILIVINNLHVKTEELYCTSNNDKFSQLIVYSKLDSSHSDIILCEADGIFKALEQIHNDFLKVYEEKGVADHENEYAVMKKLESTIRYRLDAMLKYIDANCYDNIPPFYVQLTKDINAIIHKYYSL